MQLCRLCSYSGDFGTEMVDFMAPSQTRENGLSQPFGLAREGYLPILATLAIQLCSYVGYVAIVVVLVPKLSILGYDVKPGKSELLHYSASRAKENTILVPRYRGIVVYWYLGVGVYRYIGVLGGFMGDLGYLNIDILVPWGVGKHS